MNDVAGNPIREQAMELVRSLPVNASWDDLMYRIYVRQAIERGLQDAEAGRLADVAEVRREFGLTSCN